MYVTYGQLCSAVIISKCINEFMVGPTMSLQDILTVKYDAHDYFEKCAICSLSSSKITVFR